MAQNIYKLVILKLDHRPERDKRITTHCALVSRAFGANEFCFSGIEDIKLMENVKKIRKSWGGEFEINYCEKPLRYIKDLKNKGWLIVHLTMYGLDFKEEVEKIKKKKEEQNILVVVGGSKVSREYYELADYNVAVGNQPHSEVAAIALVLFLIDNNKINIEYKDSLLKIKPESKYKKIINL